ncbi:MAG: hypothetical protein ABW173_06880 [Sphingomonas sp.]
MANPRDRLSDPDYAAFAWGRYRRIMTWMAGAALIAVAAALGWLWSLDAIGSIHMVIATTLGVGLTVLLTAALMGLVFLSSGTGHDADAHEQQQDPYDER